MGELGLDIVSNGDASPSRGTLRLAIVGGSERAAALLQLLADVANICVLGVADASRSAPAMRLAEDLGLVVTTDLSALLQLAELDLVIDMSDDVAVAAAIEDRKPPTVELLGACGAEMMWDLLVAKKRGDEQGRLFAELRVAYEQIRSHEQRVQASRDALEKANEELECRLAEIFFTHEFFKALTTFGSVVDVASLIVDGCNGILGAEISCVYLLERKDWTLRLAASQGRPEGFFRAVVPVSETVLGRAFREGLMQIAHPEVPGPASVWTVDPGDVGTSMALPLRAGEAILGVLLVSASSHRELSSADLDRLQVIANQSSLALQNALLHEELERLSVTDRLTELYNHVYFEQRLDEELGRAARFSHELSLIMLDIDDFKAFNDRYLHQQGDEVLRTVSAIIRQNLRDMDVAARYGGEEFVVVLPETDSVGAAAVAERIRQTVSAWQFRSGDETLYVGITVSIGVATYPRQGMTCSKLVEAADRAMYLAKRSGKNRVVLAD